VRRAVAAQVTAKAAALVTAAALGALAAGSAAWGVGAAAASAPAKGGAGARIHKEVLVLAAGTGSTVQVFEEVELAAPPVRPWRVPLPFGASAIAPPSPKVHVAGGVATAAAGVQDASVVYRLPASLGSVFVQDLSLPLGEVMVLAGPSVYPGLGTGLTLRGQTRIAGKTFVLFTGGPEGSGGVVHFSLSVGDPGRPWADALGIVLVLWLAAGAYLGSRRVMAALRTAGMDDAA
jgi:hypothetical protein